MSRCGCIKDKFDDRDYLMRAYLPVIRLPKKIDYTQNMSPVRDQGDEGVCVGFAAVSGMKEYQERLDYQKFVKLSPRFVYSESKKIDGMPDEEGTTIRTAMRVLKTRGVCQEKFWPYAAHQTDKPKRCVNPDAKRFRVLTYARILNFEELRMSLATKGPCVIGVEVFNGMMKTKTGVVPMPRKGEETLGGHAICCVGYEDRKKVVKFKNSWSIQWGEKGFGYLPYAYIERYMMDAWSSVDMEDPHPLTLASVLGYQTRALV
jgi:C1A family cysteine protease